MVTYIFGFIIGVVVTILLLSGREVGKLYITETKDDEKFLVLQLASEKELERISRLSYIRLRVSRK